MRVRPRGPRTPAVGGRRPAFPARPGAIPGPASGPAPGGSAVKPKLRLWPDSVVGRTSLARLITEVRKATGDRPGRLCWIRTHHGFGYSFSGEVREPANAKPGDACRLLWGSREISLGEGESLIGRAPDCTMRVDTPKTSRHHARIVITAGRAVLEDLGSRNGTYLGARPIEGPTPLGDGDEIGIGTAVLIFLGPGGTGFTETA